MPNDLCKRVIFAHDEIQIHVILPLSPLSECEGLHGRKREERRHCYVRAESLGVRYTVLEVIKRHLDAVCHKREFRILVDKNLVNNCTPLELSMQLLCGEIISRIFRKQIEVDGFPMADVERDCRATDETEIFGKQFDCR